MLYSFPFIALLILLPIFLAASPGPILEQFRFPKTKKDNNLEQPEQ